MQASRTIAHPGQATPHTARSLDFRAESSAITPPLVRNSPLVLGVDYEFHATVEIQLMTAPRCTSSIQLPI